MTDPRPRLGSGTTGPVLAGSRCTACAHPAPVARPRCGRCGGPTEDAHFAADGRVAAHTTVRIAVGERQPGYGLAYVDLVDGPRVLAHLAPDLEPVAVGDPVRLAGTTEEGDLLAVPGGRA